MKKSLLFSTALVAGLAFGQCPNPYNVTVEATTPNSVTVDAGDTGINYDIVSTARPGTINLATATPTFNDVSSPFTAPVRLAPNYNYEFYVRQDCGMDDSDVSEWVGPFRFTTQELAACPEPTGVTTVDITTSGATFQADDTSAMYDVVSSGVPEDIDITMFNEITTPVLNDKMSGYEITGLPASHTFEYYVRRDCGQQGWSLNVSPWTGPYYFTTATPCTEPTGVVTVSVGDTWATITADDESAMYDLVTTAAPGTIPVDGSGQPTMAPQFTGVSAPYTAMNLAPNYTYEFYVRNSCGSDYVGPFQFTTTGAPAAKVSPNPTNGIVKFENFNAVSAEVINYTGRTQITTQVSNNEINISQLTPGNYVINAVDAKGNVQSFKVVKK